MLTGLAAKRLKNLCESIAELHRVGTDELSTLLSMQHEVELRDRLHLEGLARLSVVVRLHGAKYDVLVMVRPGRAFVRWFEAHAGPATW